MSIDAELHAIATRAAGQYADSVLTAQGWTRQELVDAIHARLRTKYAEDRAAGALAPDEDGVIHPVKRPRRPRRHRDRTRTHDTASGCPTPTKLAFRDRTHATQVLEHWGYEDAPQRPTRAYACRCGNWHLTSQTVRGKDTDRHD